jgi:hypothetical protein
LLVVGLGFMAVCGGGAWAAWLVGWLFCFVLALVGSVGRMCVCVCVSLCHPLMRRHTEPHQPPPTNPTHSKHQTKPTSYTKPSQTGTRAVLAGLDAGGQGGETRPGHRPRRRDPADDPGACFYFFSSLCLYLSLCGCVGCCCCCCCWWWWWLIVGVGVLWRDPPPNPPTHQTSKANQNTHTQQQHTHQNDTDPLSPHQEQPHPPRRARRGQDGHRRR